MKQITCTNGNSCFVSMENIESSPILKIDFNIKEYKILNKKLTVGWVNHQFPNNTIINDKLYLNEQLKNQLMALLEHFIDTGELPDFNAGGLNYLKLKDTLGNTISIQESSSAMDHKIWFGCDASGSVKIEQNDKLVDYSFPEGTVLLEDRLHLDRNIASDLKDIIKREWNSHIGLTNENKKSLIKPG